MNGLDLAKEVTCREAWQLAAGRWQLAASRQPPAANYHVVAYDYGIKHNILRLLADHGCRVTIVPAQTPLPKFWR